MANLLVVHPVVKLLAVEAAMPIAKAIKTNHATDAYWVKSCHARKEGNL